MEHNTPDMDAKVSPNHICNRCFSIFLQFRANLVLKLQKVRVRLMRANIFGNSPIWVSKIAEFDAAIESVEKIAGKLTQKVISVNFFLPQ
jgi:hypothetical protein